jgi:hypothetical protein
MSKASQLYAAFITDPQFEKQGVYVDYGNFRVKLTRTGGANEDYLKTLQAKAKPYARAVAAEAVDESILKAILLDVFAERVIVSWETKNDEGNWVTGLYLKDSDELVPSSVENIKKALIQFPNLFAEFQEQANKLSTFRDAVRENNSKN